MDHFENWKIVELSSRSKIFVCYRYNHLGVISFEYIAGVTHGKFTGSKINQSNKIVLMDEWTNDSLCCEDAKRILQGYYLFILILFSVLTQACSMLYLWKDFL